MSKMCLICLKSENRLIKVLQSEPDNEDILSKLKNCVPEVEWDLNFEICEICTQDLNKIYDFKIVCINAFLAWKKSSLNTKEIDSIEYFDTNSNGGVNLIEDNIELSDQSNDALKSTTEIFTAKKQKVPCKNCGKLYSSQNYLTKHLKICLRMLKGIKDTKVCSNVENLTNSSGPHELLQNNFPPTCSLCGTTFCNKYLLKRHLQNVHATEKKFKCEVCGRTFTSSVYLNAHKRYHMRDRSYICSFCGKGFITASDLYHHEKIHVNKRSYRCEICPKAFNTSSDLHKHKICVHWERSKWKYVCSYCDRRFPLKINLDTHEKIHTGEKNYVCRLCDRKFISKSVLTRHTDTHTNNIAFKCSMCTQGYKSQRTLDVHMAKTHGVGNIKVPEKANKKFICHLCSKSYFANNKLQKHIRSHSGERPFHCPHCTKSFVDKSYIKQHLKIAHNIVESRKEEY